MPTSAHPSQTRSIEKTLTEHFNVPLDKITQAATLNSTNHLGLLNNLQKLGALTDKQMVEVESVCFGIPIVSLKNYPVIEALDESVSKEWQVKYNLVPIAEVGHTITIATSSVIAAKPVIDQIFVAKQRFIQFVLAHSSEIQERVGAAGKPAGNIDQMLEQKAKDLYVSAQDLDIEKASSDPNGPVAQVITHLLTQAVNEGASDIHIEPFTQMLRIRFRDDGLLREVKTFDKVFTPSFTAAVKVKASMDIAETRMPQDGAISLQVSGRRVDFRVATYPTESGEKIVLRILDSNKDWISLDSLQLPEVEKQKLIHLIESPQGLVLCAGPTGSGKTSTLYSMLKHLNTPDINILTIEDPIEYRMNSIIQAQVNHKKGFTFASGLRAMLRLDPNIILVGEMRDQETAEIGAQAALTGHMVLSTIHANSSSQTMARLIDMGVEQFVVANALEGVISQRLARKICPRCTETFVPTEQQLKDAGFTTDLPKELSRGKGCHACHHEGYKGRIPILELMVVSNEMRALIASTASPGQLYEAAIQNGMWTIRQDALHKCRNGLTTIEEIIRVIGRAPAAEKASIAAPMKAA